MFTFITRRSYVQLFLAMALGVVIGHRWPIPVTLLVRDALLFALVLLALTGLWWVWRNAEGYWTVLPGFAALAVSGMISVSIAVGMPLTAPLTGHAGDGVVLNGKVASIPKYQRGHLRFLMRVESIGEKDPAPTDGICYVYLKCPIAPELYYTDEVTLTADLDEVRPPLNRGQFDYRHYLMLRGTVLTAYADSSRSLIRVTTGRPPVWSQLDSMRTWLTGNLSMGRDQALSELAVSVVYGDKITELPESMEERFRRAGLTHILVASGTQVSLLIMLLALLLWRFRNDFTWRSLLTNLLQFTVTLAVVLAYAAITGLETSIIRALAMGVLVLVGKLIHREVDGLTCLAQSGLILLLINPLLLFSPGFLLSFGATFGLIYVGGVWFPVVAQWTGWRKLVGATLVSTGGAQLFVLPVLATCFNQLSVWGLVSNLIAIPLAFILLIIGGLTSLGLVHVPFIGELLSGLTTALCWTLDWVARVFSLLPGSDIAVPSPPWWWLVSFYLACFLGMEWVKYRETYSSWQLTITRYAVPALTLVLAAGMLAWWIVPRPELAALALYKGEAYIWRPRTGRTVLIARRDWLDRAHNDDTVLSALRYRGINKVHGMVWLDGLPGDDPLKLSVDSTLSPGSSLPGDWDMEWLIIGGNPVGAVAGIGSDPVWVIWERIGSDYLDALAAYSGRSPAVIIMDKGTYASLSMGVRAELARMAGKMVVMSADGAGQGIGDVVIVSREAGIRPARGGLKMAVFTATTP